MTEIITINIPGLPADTRPLRLVRIPAGSFLMGEPAAKKEQREWEGPVRTVHIRDAFYIGEAPITQPQWETLMGKNPSGYGECGLDYPVEWVSWRHCQDFVAVLNVLGQGIFRLPSEAEWEYACRAGSQTVYYYGDDEERLGEYGWPGNNSGGRPHPVGEKQPNAWGLYDMHGNVWEWCADDWHDNYTGAPTDGRAWVDSPRGEARVVRGGCWRGYARNCSSASRSGYAPGERAGDIGVRVVRKAS